MPPDAPAPFVARPPLRAASPDPPPAVDLGPLAPALADPRTTDVFVTGDGAVWVDRGAGVERLPGGPLPEAGVRELAVRLVSAGGRHVDEATPLMDVRLPGGLRVHAVLPPIAPAGALLSVRVARRDPLDLASLERGGFFDAVPSSRLRDLVLARRNLLVTGAGGSGKTTLLGALLALAPPTERLVVIEDVGELRIDHPHVVALEARQPNLEGAGGVGLDRLVREALRMRPDRLVVGECRGPETRELLAALNTGHDGGAGTLHANSLADVPARLEALGALAGLDRDALARQAVSAVHAVAHVERTGTGRRLAALGRLVLDGAGRLGVEAA
jgi:pilus assembly protein CpaF